MILKINNNENNNNKNDIKNYINKNYDKWTNVNKYTFAQNATTKYTGYYFYSNKIPIVVILQQQFYTVLPIFLSKNHTRHYFYSNKMQNAYGSIFTATII